MTLPLYVRVPGRARWCRLIGIGVVSMVPACRVPISARAAVQIDSNPPAVDRCRACERELAARPGAAVVFDVEDLDDDTSVGGGYEEISVGRAPTVEIRPRAKSDPPAAWDSMLWEPDSRDHGSDS